MTYIFTFSHRCCVLQQWIHRISRAMNVIRAIGAQALVSSLEHLAELSVGERMALETLPITVVSAAAGEEICLSGQVPSASYLILEGWISASKSAAGHKRQITNFYIPSDMPDLRSLHLKVVGSDMTAVTACRLALLDHAELLALTQTYPGIAEALWKHTLVTGAIFEEWIVNVGLRPAASRVAHLFCELMARLEAVGLARDNRCDLPLTQSHLGEATGLSRIHVNRSLQELRKQGLVSYGYGELIIHDRAGLARVAQFDPMYLHLRRATQQVA